MGRMGVQDVVEHALVVAILDREEETERAFADCIDRHRAGEVLQ